MCSFLESESEDLMRVSGSKGGLNRSCDSVCLILQCPPSSLIQFASVLSVFLCFIAYITVAGVLNEKPRNVLSII